MNVTQSATTNGVPMPPVAPTTTPARVDLRERAVLLALEVSCWTNRRKVQTGQVDVTDATAANEEERAQNKPDKTMLSISKKLLEAPELVAITQFLGSMRRWLTGLALPSQFRSGVYTIPLPLVAEVTDKLRDYQIELAKLVNDACNAYPQRIREATERHKVLYDPRDYPAVETFRESFSIAWRFLEVGTPTSLASVSQVLFESERQKLEKQMSEAVDEIRAALRVAFLDLVSHTVERLQPGEDGKPKTFRNTLVTNMQEFLKTFDVRNLTDDIELRNLITRAQGLLDGRDATELRKDNSTREAILRGFSDIKNALDPLVADRPSRQIRFDEEE